jgi:cytoskeletal protein RodZ
MEPMSRILRQARERRGISLQEVERLTRIPFTELQLLEGEGDQRGVADLRALLPSLRRYAAFLNLNPDTTVVQFTAEVQDLQPVEKHADGSERPPPVFELSPQRFRVLPRTLSLLLALGILVLVWHYGELLQWDWPKEDGASPPVAASPQAEPLAPAVPRVESPAVIAPPRPQDVSGSSLHRLQVRGKEETWLRVTIDGRQTKELFLHPGQSVEWSAERDFCSRSATREG